MSDLLILIVILGIAAAIYIGVKAHLHNTTNTAELKNQGNKLVAIEAHLAQKAKDELAYLRAKVSANPAPVEPPVPPVA